jgi:2-keto-3-deoxy-L-rhamnonate aldolase RhmA
LEPFLNRTALEEIIMPLVPNLARQRLSAGELALGFGIHHLRGSAAGMIAAAAGYDWLFIDMEHGAMSVHEATQIAIAALNQGVTPIVRVCRDAIFEGTRALDNGAMGVVVPHIDTAEEAREVAAAYRFPPIGTRSWGGPPFAYNFKPPAVAEAQVELNKEIIDFVQIEFFYFEFINSLFYLINDYMSKFFIFSFKLAN